eukprot:255761-Pleurochrysis_carterae.AAC.1
MRAAGHSARSNALIHETYAYVVGLWGLTLHACSCGATKRLRALLAVVLTGAESYSGGSV